MFRTRFAIQDFGNTVLAMLEVTRIFTKTIQISQVATITELLVINSKTMLR
jgi:hypothetical protein